MLRIREIRAELGWTLEELASRCGMTSGEISRLERGRQWTTAKKLQTIARALGRPVADLFEGPRHDPGIAELLNLFDRLSPERQEDALALLRALAERRDRD